eukprot:COSAG01_NODE_1347_length_10632_cov_29.175370_1_plen_266_part_00
MRRPPRSGRRCQVRSHTSDQSGPCLRDAHVLRQRTQSDRGSSSTSTDGACGPAYIRPASGLSRGRGPRCGGSPTEIWTSLSPAYRRRPCASSSIRHPGSIIRHPDQALGRQTLHMSTHNIDVLIAHCRQACVNHRIRHLHYDSFIDVVREVIPAAAQRQRQRQRQRRRHQARQRSRAHADTRYLDQPRGGVLPRPLSRPMTPRAASTQHEHRSQAVCATGDMNEEAGGGARQPASRPAGQQLESSGVGASFWCAGQFYLCAGRND